MWGFIAHIYKLAPILMNLEIENISTEDVDNLIASNRSRTILFSPIDIPFYISRKNNALKIKGLLFKATGIIDSVNRQVILSIKFRTTYKIVAFLVALFLIGFLLSNKVTLNGNSNPTIIDKLVFVSVGIVLLIIIPYSLLNRIKSNFKNKTKQLLEKKNWC